MPTGLGHWEIYSFTAGEGHRSDVDDDLGFDLNDSAVKGVQLTALTDCAAAVATLSSG